MLLIYNIKFQKVRILLVQSFFFENVVFMKCSMIFDIRKI